MQLTPYQDFINGSKVVDKVALINELFEPSKSILQFTLYDNDFMELVKSTTQNYEDFIDAIRSQLLKLSEAAEKSGSDSKDVDHLINIISSHPRIGETTNLSIHSQNEQKNLQKTADSPEVQRRLAELNAKYENTYPGLKFIVFVNGRKRPEIIALMEQRITSGNSWFKEANVALNELCDIAEDRVRKSQLE